MAEDLAKLMGVSPEEPEDDEEDEETTEVSEDETEEVDEQALKYEAGKKALRAERKRVRELEAELKAVKSGKQATNERETIRAEVAREFGLELAREKAISLLKDEGYRGNPDRGAKLLELDTVLDSTGKVDSSVLSDLVQEWKEDEPQLFKRSRRTDVEDEDETPRRKSTGSPDLGRKAPTKSTDNPLQSALEKMVGNTQLF